MLKTEHRIRFGDARRIDFLEDESVDLVVTSPPYPMIGMWDEQYRQMSPSIAAAWGNREGSILFDLMHAELDRVWTGLYRVLREGGTACINIGDATRSIGGRFGLYPNHARVLMKCIDLGFHALPLILWRKPTNAPNKFMGSGMLPVGAYVTLEHEYIIILRKGGLRRFGTEDERLNRARSALFWEERNCWYSDIWEMVGVRQRLDGDTERGRSAAFPFELAYRIINMYSIRGERVFDPFLGTGTTLFAAMASCRNSFGLELDRSFLKPILARVDTAVEELNGYLAARLEAHMHFVEDYEKRKKPLRHRNVHYGFPVMTRQERELLLCFLKEIRIVGSGHLRATYREDASAIP